MQNPLIFNKFTNTFPSIFHSPGMDNKNYNKTNSTWPRISKILYKTNSHPDLEVVLCNNYQDKSIVEFNLEKYVIIGNGVEKWNNIHKIQLMLDYVRNLDKKYILYLDSRDVVVLGRLSEVVKIFNEKKCNVFFNCETKFYPQCETLREVEIFQRKISPTKYFALNAGCWIAKTDHLKKYLQYVVEMDMKNHLDNNKKLERNRIENSDQFRWHIAYKEFYPEIQVDYNCEIFQSLYLHAIKDFCFKIF